LYKTKKSAFERKLNGIKCLLIDWEFTKYKAINFAIGISALLFYEFVGRTIYQPYIYNNNINDLHIDK
jgi:hypothetical protein